MGLRIDFTDPDQYVEVNCSTGASGEMEYGVYFLGEKIADLPDYDWPLADDDRIREEYGEKVAKILAGLIRKGLAED